MVLLHGPSLIAARIVGGALCILSLALFVLAMPVHIRQLLSAYSPEQLAQLGLPSAFFAWYVLPFDLIFIAIFVVTAGVISWRRSHDPMILHISVALIVFAVSFPSAVANLGIEQPVWQWPIKLVLTLADVLMLMALYLFPDFRIYPDKMRWVALVSVIWLLIAGGLQYTRYNIPESIIYPMYMVTYGCGAVAQIHRYRTRADAQQRQQTKWIVFGCCVAIICVNLIQMPFIIFPDAPNTVPGLIYNLFRIPLRLLGAALVPLSIAFSVLRYRLWNIDFVINRSLVYGALTGLLLLLLTGSVFLISRLFENFSGGPLVAVAISAAIFGAVFQPARRHLQRFVDQRFYNIQIDYQKTPPPDPYERIKSLPHTRLGDYQNLELIGRGGMGEVYKATHPTLGQPIAIKLLPAALAADEAFRQRFEREARLVGVLKHPNIIRLIDSGVENGTLYMVMEYVSGKDLSTHLRESGRLTLDEARRPLREIAAALDFAHAQGMVHRDIKPGNIMIEANRAVLMDFGIAKLVAGQTSLTNTGVLGTLDYIAPEQIQASADVDGRADIYAFGVVVYQTLTGVLPFQNQNPGALLMAHLMQPPPDPRELIPQLSLSAAFAIQRAMAKRPDERFGSAGEFIEAVFE